MIPIRRNAVLQEIPDTGETVVCNVDGGVMVVLNDTGAAVWLLMDGRRTLDDIAGIVASTLGASQDVARRDVETFLHGLRERGLVDLPS